MPRFSSNFNQHRIAITSNEHNSRPGALLDLKNNKQEGVQTFVLLDDVWLSLELLLLRSFHHESNAYCRRLWKGKGDLWVRCTGRNWYKSWRDRKGPRLYPYLCTFFSFELLVNDSLDDESSRTVGYIPTYSFLPLT